MRKKKNKSRHHRVFGLYVSCLNQKKGWKKSYNHLRLGSQSCWDYHVRSGNHACPSPEIIMFSLTAMHLICWDLLVVCHGGHLWPCFSGRPAAVGNICTSLTRFSCRFGLLRFNINSGRSDTIGKQCTPLFPIRSECASKLLMDVAMLSSANLAQV